MKLYRWEEETNLGKIVTEKSYKHIQKLLALILRPEIDQEEL